jgi:hypothetical protein
MRTLLATVVVALLVAPAATAGLSAAPDLQARVHTTIKVDCGQGGDWKPASLEGFDPAGYALMDEQTAVLSPDVCAILRGPLIVNNQWAYAALTLFHELAHIGWQNRDESATECFALYTFRWEMRHSFGLTAGQAQRAYEFAWQVHQTSPAQYKGCATYMAQDPLARY